MVAIVGEKVVRGALKLVRCLHHSCFLAVDHASRNRATSSK